MHRPAIIIDFDGSGVGHVYFYQQFQRASSLTCKHRLGYNHKFEWAWNGPFNLLQTISNSIVHDKVSTFLTIITDVKGPGVAHAYFCKRFHASDFKGYRVSWQTTSNSLVHDNVSLSQL